MATETSRRLRRKEIEHLENTSIAIFGLMGDSTMDGCTGATTCDCGITGVQCCEGSSTCVAAVSFNVQQPTAFIDGA